MSNCSKKLYHIHQQHLGSITVYFLRLSEQTPATVDTVDNKGNGNILFIITQSMRNSITFKNTENKCIYM